jgi:hypothetical protein
MPCPRGSAGASSRAELADTLAVEPWGNVLVEELGAEFGPASDL